MATLRATVLGILNDDATLDGIVTGGFFDVNELPNDGLTYANIEKEANGVTVKMTGVLRWRGLQQVRGPDKAARGFVEVFLYDDPSNGADNLDSAKRRIWTLLHDKYLGDTDYEGFAWLVWVGDLGEAPGGAGQDDVLMANMDRMRFQIDLTRK